MIARTDTLSKPGGDAGALDAILARLDSLLEAKPTRYLSIADAAHYASLSQDSIRRLIERGDLRGLRPVKGKVLVDRQELDRVIPGSASRASTRGAHLHAAPAGEVVG